MAITKRNHKCKECGAERCWDWTFEYNEETSQLDSKVWECQNCFYTEPYVEFKFRKDTITPSQNRKIAKIKSLFENLYSRNPIDLAVFNAELDQETGRVYVKVETTANIYTMNGGFFSITRMGKVTCHRVASLTKNADSRARFYEKMLKG